MRRRMVPLLAAVAATAALAAGAALAATVTGTDGPDTLVGTMKDDRIEALAGNDHLYGLNGPDTYRGGDDRLSENLELGTPGAPAPPPGEGYTGKDVMYGEGGTDVLIGARSADTLYGGPNNPDPSSTEALFGDTGDDTLKGGDGRDNLQGAGGRDRLLGGRGPGFLDAAFSETVGTPDVVDCGAGTDTAVANNNDTVKNCEDVIRVANPS